MLPLFYWLSIRPFIFESGLQDNEEIKMKKIFFIICLAIVMFNLAACSDTPTKYGNSSEQQRKNAKEAHDELSTDVNRGAR